MLNKYRCLKSFQKMKKMFFCENFQKIENKILKINASGKNVKRIVISDKEIEKKDENSIFVLYDDNHQFHSLNLTLENNNELEILNFSKFSLNFSIFSKNSNFSYFLPKNHFFKEKTNKITIHSQNSKILIQNFNGSLKYFGEQNNNVKLKNLYLTSLEYYNGENDSSEISLMDLEDNSIIEQKENSSLSLKISPILGFGINIFSTFTDKFIKLPFFDREGYSFCPTLILKTNKEYKRDDLIDYDLVQIFPKRTKRVFLSLLFCFWLFVMIGFNDNVFESFSELKNQQLFMKSALTENEKKE